MANSPDITCSKSTVYRHFHKGYYSASLIDLPRAVRFRKRRAKHQDYVPSGVKAGRSHDDFLDFCGQHLIEQHVELDTVIGRVGGKVIMTIDIVPKGSSFDDFSQETVNLIFSHVNSVSRAIYGGKTPFELFSFLYGSSAARLFGITEIPPEQVVQSPLLLKGIAELSKNL